MRLLAVLAVRLSKVKLIFSSEKGPDALVIGIGDKIIHFWFLLRFTHLSIELNHSSQPHD